MSKFKTKPQRGSTPMPDHIFITINGNPETSMTVSWRTSVDVKIGYALCRKDGETEYKKFDAETDVFESDIDISNMFWVNMTDLEPDTKYYYSVGDDNNRSGEFYFTTAPENLDTFKFICVSDQQSGEPHHLPDYSSFNEFLNDVLKKHPDARFILTGGDNTDCGQHEVQWNGAFSGLKGIVEHIPFMMTIGNHDNRGFEDYEKGIGRYYSEPAEFFGKQFKGSYPYNGPKKWKTENYSFDYGNAHFNVIGVNGPEDVNEWLKEDIGASSKTWKFGCHHFPIYYSGPELANDDTYPMMREGVEMLDVIFSGHEHNFSRSYPIKNESLYEKPSQGTVHYELGNSNYNPPGTPTNKKVWHAAYYPQSEHSAAVAIIEVFPDKLVMTTELNDGRIVDKCVIDKANDLILPPCLPPYFRRPRVFYKGVDLGIGQSGLWPEQKEGIWYAPLYVLFNVACADVLKEKGKITLGIYGKSATFTDGSDEAVTPDGVVKLPGKVYRGNRDQLYIPVEAVVSCFDMKWNFAENNNYISIEHISEDIPCTVQP